MKTASNIKKVKLNIRELWPASWRQYRQSFWRLFTVAFIIALPAGLLRLTGQNGVPDLSYVGSIASLFMIISLLIVALGLESSTEQSLTKLYNQSSSYFLRYVALSLLQAVVGVPLVVSFFLIVLSVAVRFAAWPVFLIGSLAVLCYFLVVFVRFALAPLVLIDQKVSSWQSLRLSWRMIKGRFWKVFFNLGAILLGIIIVSGLSIELLNFIPFIHQNDIWNAVLSGVLLSVFLPFLIVYATNIYKKLR